MATTVYVSMEGPEGEFFYLENEAELLPLLKGEKNYVRVSANKPTWIHASAIVQIVSDTDPFAEQGTVTT